MLQSVLKHRIIDILNDYSKLHTFPSFQVESNLSPIVKAERNFDDLLIPPDHISRSKSDTYYLNEGELLRTHTSAHQTTLISQDVESFLVVGDVYRRDEIDRSHYPVFHQMEGVRLFSDPTISPQDIQNDLKTILEFLAKGLFGDVKMRWIDEYFPFTEPSFELEIFFEGDWMEVLGCGVIHPGIFENAQKLRQQQCLLQNQTPEKAETQHASTKSEELSFSKGWAFGLGLERLAMVLFDIPDIRLFWTEDERFHTQFKQGQIKKFEPYSKYPPCNKDISFWTTTVEEGEENRIPFTPNDFFDLAREKGGDWIESIELTDTFTHPKTQRTSLCYRLVYRSMDRNLTNEEVDILQENIRREVEAKLAIELR